MLTRFYYAEDSDATARFRRFLSNSQLVEPPPLPLTPTMLVWSDAATSLILCAFFLGVVWGMAGMYLYYQLIH